MINFIRAEHCDKLVEKIVILKGAPGNQGIWYQIICDIAGKAPDVAGPELAAEAGRSWPRSTMMSGTTGLKYCRSKRRKNTYLKVRKF